MKITIIGFGTMGKAISKAILRNDSKIKVFIVDKSNAKRSMTGENIRKSDFIILAVKPQNAKETIEQNKIYFNNKSILISIMAGVSIKKLMLLSDHKKVIRMMPNLGLSVGEGIAVWKGVGLSLFETKKAKNFLSKITENFEVRKEDTINKVTAVSGSGPAYFFLLAGYLIDACSNLGLNQNESRQLVEKTFSAASILGKGNDYFTLIKKVASKKGTTEAALKVFKKENFKGVVLKAVRAAYKRAQELNDE